LSCGFTLENGSRLLSPGKGRGPSAFVEEPVRAVPVLEGVVRVVVVARLAALGGLSSPSIRAWNAATASSPST
jgi:hypothetical protein